ncbi:MAG: ABC transporter ATP-binding protein [Saccharofermentanales bacterium]
MEIFTIRDVSFRYPQTDLPALDHVDLSVGSGDFIVVCGETGCGKTTLLKMLKRAITPQGEFSGEILYNGIPLTEIDDMAAACEIGYVYQNPESQIVTDKVWHELAFGLENMGLPTPVIRRRTGEIAGFLGIENWFRKDTAHLSGGQKQLLNLASVMVMQPKVIILDEPTSQLDPIAASEFIGTLQKINRELGMTVILVEHRLEDVFPVADKVILMEKGRVILYDTPKNVAAHLKDLDPGHHMLSALPSAVRIFSGLRAEGECPLTVKEGRSFLNGYCSMDETHTPGRHRQHRYDSRPAGPPVVELDDVWFRYGRDLPDIMRGVSFRVAKGETYCILGGNGSGKTTALSVLCGILKSYKGKITICGKKIKDYSPVDLYRNNIAFLPQNAQIVFLKETVREDFAEVCDSMEYSEEYRAEAVSSLCRTFGISHLLDKHPYDLSGGEQQKCALCKLLLLKPKIILLDEPTKGFDSFGKKGLRKIISDLKADGIAIIIVTHDVEFAAVNADRCAMFFDGQIISEDTPDMFFSLNNFYTTAANRIAREIYPNAITCEDVIEFCRRDGYAGE